MSTSTIDSFISVVGNYEIDPLDAEAFKKIAAESVEQTVSKHGCLYYIASQDVKRANVFHLSEGWATQADLDAHGDSPAFKAMLEQASKLRIVKRAIYLSVSKGRTLLA
ncbi:MAG: putative quinol monooxygenase [Pseudomonadota bacterium]